MFTIPNLGLSIQDGFCWVFGVSFFLTFLTFINTNIKDPIMMAIKKKEENLSFIQYFELYVNRFLHHISTICIVALPYIFKPKYVLYILYEMYLCIALYSWYLLRECPISIHEKQLLHTKYANGDNNLHPFMCLIVPNNIYVFVFTTMYIINLMLISYSLYHYNYNDIILH